MGAKGFAPDEEDKVISSETLRKDVVRMIVERKSGHLCSSLSVLDILASLILDCDPFAFGDDGNAHLILSKGHAAPALYATLARAGKLDPNELSRFRRLGAGLEGHPRQGLVSTVEVSTGSLGNGVAHAVGLALSYRGKPDGKTVVCVVSDGEIQTGIALESMQVAVHYGAAHLILIADCNGWQTSGPVDRVIGANVEKRLGSLGVRCSRANGHDREALRKMILHEAGKGPAAILAQTKRGFGVPGLPEAEVYGEQISDAESRRLLAWCGARDGTD